MLQQIPKTLPKKEVKAGERVKFLVAKEKKRHRVEGSSLILKCKRFNNFKGQQYSTTITDNSNIKTYNLSNTLRVLKQVSLNNS